MRVGQYVPAARKWIARHVGDKLDEVVASNAKSVHLEQMDTGHWWLGVEVGGELIHVNLYTRRNAEICARVESEKVPRRKRARK